MKTAEQIINNLPIDFVNNMKILLADEFTHYINSFNEESTKGIHINTAIADSERILCQYSSFLEKLDYSDNGYISSIEKIGANPLFHSGLVYSQDPGAQMPIASLPFDFEEGDYVLDLCAAPGGKSSQLAIKLSKCGGFLLSNEPDPKRNKILRSNVERMGYKNVTITGLMPEQIGQLLPGLFKLIVIDAPCSGEGMFRKYPESINEWSSENVCLCHNRQINIIDSIMPALCRGGYLLYSTCTYNKAENEEIVDYIKAKYNLEIIQPNSSIYKYAIQSEPENGYHFYPHIAKGEGQFLCIFKDKNPYQKPNYKFINPYKKASSNTIKLIQDALKDNFNYDEVTFYEKDGRILLIPDDKLPYLSKGTTSYGILAGDIEKNRFIPHHQLFKCYGNLFKNITDLSNDEQSLNNYLLGQEIVNSDTKNGYGVIKYLGAYVGGYKASNGRLKNHYPKGLRN